MSPVLKGRNPALIFGATFAIAILLLVGVELVAALSSGISEEQRASQAVYTAFGYQEDCDAFGSTQRVFWCGSLVTYIDTCYLKFGKNSQIRYYDCYSPPTGLETSQDPDASGQWGCVVDQGGDRGMRLVALRGGRAGDQNPCGRRLASSRRPHAAGGMDLAVQDGAVEHTAAAGLRQ